jgi:hypothetical protein
MKTKLTFFLPPHPQPLSLNLKKKNKKIERGAKKKA